MTPNDSPIITRRQGRIGRLTVNRPRALNALDHAMVVTFHNALMTWRDDPAVEAVVVEGAGERAFCAGGDIRRVRDLTLAGDYAGIEAFFADEYALNAAIARYPKPYVALIGGLCMGGGMGLSVHGSHRVVTDTTVMAMPETNIGFFPDVGASFFLSRLQVGQGMFLALTGARVQGAEAVGVGLATHHVTNDRLATLADEMAQDGVAALANMAQPPSAGSKPGQEELLACFAASSVADILARLETLDSISAREALTTLRSVSPTAVLWTFELMRLGATRTLEQCQALELALTRHAVRHPDFAEGVRAMVVDKDRQPRWSPARIEDVPIGDVRAMFRQLGDS